MDTKKAGPIHINENIVTTNAEGVQSPVFNISRDHPKWNPALNILKLAEKKILEKSIDKWNKFKPTAKKPKGKQNTTVSKEKINAIKQLYKD